MDILLIIAGIIFTFGITGFVFCLFYENVKSKDEKSVIENNVSPEGLDFTNAKRISSQVFTFDMETKFVDCYYNEENLYVVKSGITAKFSLESITEIRRTSLSINNCRIWKVTVKDKDGKELVFDFRPFAMRRNKGFIAFLEKMKTVNRSAIKSEWNWWFT
jgi:hypothetical protein